MRIPPLLATALYALAGLLIGTNSSAGTRPEITSQTAVCLDHVLSVNVQWQSANPVTKVRILAGHGDKETPVDEYDNRRNPSGYQGEVSVLVPLDSSLAQGDMSYQIQLEDDLREKSAFYSGSVSITNVASAAPQGAVGMGASIQMGMTYSPTSGATGTFGISGVGQIGMTLPPPSSPTDPYGQGGMPGSPSTGGMPGSPSMNGMSGSPGMNGMSGSPGMNGMSGSPGMNGMSGSPGMNGMSGSPGMNGMSGSPGMNGMPGSPSMGGMPGTAPGNGDDGWGRSNIHAVLTTQPQTQGQAPAPGGGGRLDLASKLEQVLDRFDSPPALDEIKVNILGPENVSFSSKATDDKGLREVSFRVYDPAGNKIGEQKMGNLGKVWQGSTEPVKATGGGTFRVIAQAVDSSGNTSKEQSATFTLSAAPKQYQLVVTLVPDAAVTAGAQWQVDGGAWQSSAAALQLSAGKHQISFKDVAGWTLPIPQDIDLQEGNNSATGKYAN